MFRQFLVKLRNIKIHENFFSGFRVVTYGRVDALVDGVRQEDRSQRKRAFLINFSCKKRLKTHTCMGYEILEYWTRG
jgi:hypothetical protein